MLKKGTIPIRHLTVYRLTCAKPADALRDRETLHEYPIAPTTGVHGVLYVRPPEQNPPAWVQFVEQGTLAPLPELANASTSAVLFVESSGGLYAYCFGHGHTFIDPEAIEHDFGLRVAINAVDPRRLRSLDSLALFQEMPLHTRRQTSRNASLTAFGIDIVGDLLRGVTGEPRDPQLAVRVTGRDALVLEARVMFDDLAAQTRTLDRLRRSRAYRRDFDWVDHVKIVREPVLRAELDERLLEKLRSGRSNGIDLAPPGVIDFANVAGFSFDTDPDHVVRAEPALEDYLATLRHPPSLAMLHRHHMTMHGPDGEEPIGAWPVFRALTGELRRRGDVYVLSEGEWYAVARKLSVAVDRFVGRFEENSIAFPPARENEQEKNYNQRVARLRRWTLGDRKTVQPAGARSPIEFCDLMTPERQIIHVKPRSASSTLSHLFAQGCTSAEAFLYDRTFRDRVRTRLSASKRFRSCIPRRNPKPQRYEVAFAIIGGSREKWPYSLPFLTKLNFRNAAQRLQRFGYRVSLNYVARA